MLYNIFPIIWYVWEMALLVRQEKLIQKPNMKSKQCVFTLVHFCEFPYMTQCIVLISVAGITAELQSQHKRIMDLF